MKPILPVLLLSVFFAQNASALCDPIRTKVEIITKPGNVEYITKYSRDEFIKMAPTKVSPNTMGLTVTRLGAQGSAEGYLKQGGAGACAGIEKVIVTIGYDDLIVYIDKKYKPNSCEYRVIKDHEDYHVAVSQQAMAFYRKDIEKTIRKAVDKLSVRKVRSQAEAHRVVEEQLNQVMAELQVLVARMNQKIAEKNYLIDTPESYRETSKKCRNW
ncbi:MAG: hypothetical protein PHX68_00295 [Alphaproteobacteria bacterium]|nr:hypothetical protein [Alphaproteobacteria bacterium]